MVKELIWKSATEIRRLVLDKQVSPVEVIESSLARLDEVEPKINAFVDVTRDQALSAAREAERLPRNSTPATDSGGSSDAHIIAEVLYSLGESGSNTGLVAFDEIVSAEVLVERAILQHVVDSCQQ